MDKKGEDVLMGSESVGKVPLFLVSDVHEAVQHVVKTDYSGRGDVFSGGAFVPLSEQITNLPLVVGVSQT